MIDICHVQVLPIMSGVQRAMLEMLRHVDRRRYRPHVVCQGPGALPDELRRLDIPCHIVPSLVRPILPWRDMQAYRALVTLFRRHEFQLVHTHSSKPGILGRIAARHAGVPVVVHHVHAFAFHEFTPRPQRAVYSLMERWAGGYGDHVIFVNHEERELAVREKLLPAAKCLTIHNGVDLAPYSLEEHDRCRAKFRTDHQLDDDETAILFSGRIDVPKQPLLLPKIAAALDRRLPTSRWRLFIAGAGPMEPQMHAEIARFEMGRRIVCLGWQQQPHPAYHGCDIAVQPSLWEGLPLSVVEAHAAGLPVVGSNVKGIREVITPETGVLCPPREPESFAVELAKLVENRFQRQKLGMAARRRAVAHFDGNRNMRQVAELYDRWLGGEVVKQRRAA